MRKGRFAVSIYQTLRKCAHGVAMQKDDLISRPIPMYRHVLIETLKLGLRDAIEGGKVSDAKIYLDVIERLATMDWLDGVTPEQRRASDKLEEATMLRKIDQHILDVLRAAD